MSNVRNLFISLGDVGLPDPLFSAPQIRMNGNATAHGGVACTVLTATFQQTNEACKVPGS
jgi:hypothetical protein